jgi:hypothetical protein
MPWRLCFFAPLILLAGCFGAAACRGLWVSNAQCDEMNQALTRSLGNPLNLFRRSAASPPNELGSTFLWAGRIEASDALPAGTVFVATDTFRQIDNNGAASLVVTYDAATPDGENSYAADVVAHCATGFLELAQGSTFQGLNGDGVAVNSQALARPVMVEKPSKALAAAAKTICDLRR